MKESHPDKDNSCLVCGKDLANKEELLEHVQVHRGAEGKFYPTCDHCGRKFLTQYNMVAHKKEKHSLANNLSCRFCGKIFKCAKFLANHEAKHESGELIEKTYECSHENPNGEICGKVFNNKHNFERHQKSHNNANKVHKCLECGKTFVDSTRLKHHRWIHTGHNPFKCKICNLGFKHS
ncbi:MAG: C2H2-type zinc finger protein, partial [Myxococcota bacterium]